jgi:hypothetical protein
MYHHRLRDRGSAQTETGTGGQCHSCLYTYHGVNTQGCIHTHSGVVRERTESTGESNGVGHARRCQGVIQKADCQIS